MEKYVLEILQILQPLVHTHPFWPGHLTPREDTLTRIERLIVDLEDLIQNQHLRSVEPASAPLFLQKPETENV